MKDNINWSFHCHADPCHAETSRAAAALILQFEPNRFYPDVTIFCSSSKLASDLADAINGVLKAHTDRARPSLPSAAVSRVLHHITLTDEREVSPGIFVGRDVKDGHLRAYTVRDFIGYAGKLGDEGFHVEFCADCGRGEWTEYKRSTREAAEKLLEAKAKRTKL